MQKFQIAMTAAALLFATAAGVMYVEKATKNEAAKCAQKGGQLVQARGADDSVCAKLEVIQ